MPDDEHHSITCAPALPPIYVGFNTRPHPLTDPFMASDAWNERSWHSMRKALNAAKIADNAVREGYRYLQWSDVGYVGAFILLRGLAFGSRHRFSHSGWAPDNERVGRFSHSRAAPDMPEYLE